MRSAVTTVTADAGAAKDKAAAAASKILFIDA
jgi:hypothetical protein